MKKIFVISILFLFSAGLSAQNRPVPFTQADRDLLIRYDERFEAFDAKLEALNAKIEALDAKMDAGETRIDALEKSIDVRFDTQQKQIDNLSQMFFWGFGIIIALIIAQFAYTVWDRRTAIAPVRDMSKDNNERTNLIEKTLQDYAKFSPDLAEIMKTRGLL